MGKSKYTSPIFCSHANECPAECPCPPNCSCKKYMCKDKPRKKTLVEAFNEAGIKVETILLTPEQMAEWDKRDKEFAKWVKERDLERLKTDKHLKKWPMHFKLSILTGPMLGKASLVEAVACASHTNTNGDTSLKTKNVTKRKKSKGIIALDERRVIHV